jgi:hypothetical protein
MDRFAESAPEIAPWPARDFAVRVGDAGGGGLARGEAHLYILYMSQLNIHLHPRFEAELQEFMELRGIPTKSEAVRVAVSEGVARAKRARSPESFRAWIGLAAQGRPNPKPRFRSDAEIW